MGRLRVFVCFWWILWVPLLAAPSRQGEIATKVSSWAQEMGDPELARQIREGFQSGSIRFGETPDGDNAATSAGGGTIVLNSRLADQFGYNRGDFGDAADLVATLAHELTHQKQSRASWAASYWGNALGGEHPCERQGWAAGFQAYAGWVDRLRQELARATSASQRELVAERLRDVSLGFLSYYDNYPPGYGAIRLTDRDGIPVSLEVMAQTAREALKSAEDTVVVTTAITGFDGLYSVTNVYDKSGQSHWQFTVKGTNVRVVGSTGTKPDGTFDPDTGKLTIPMAPDLNGYEGVLRRKERAGADILGEGTIMEGVLAYTLRVTGEQATELAERGVARPNSQFPVQRLGVWRAQRDPKR